MKIERIYTCAESGNSQREVPFVELVAGHGIVGDRHFGRSKWPGQNLTLIEAEEIEAFLNEHQLSPDFSISRRNLITRGIRLNELVGKEFRVGAVLLKGIELCEPCGDLGKRLSGLIRLSDNSPALSPKAVIDRFLGKGGLRVDVLASGMIAVGDKITR